MRKLVTDYQPIANSQVVVARKKDGTPRFCIKYKPLNKVTVIQHFPLPSIENLLDKMANARVIVISALDDQHS